MGVLDHGDVASTHDLICRGTILVSLAFGRSTGRRESIRLSRRARKGAGSDHGATWSQGRARKVGTGCPEMGAGDVVATFSGQHVRHEGGKGLILGFCVGILRRWKGGVGEIIRELVALVARAGSPMGIWAAKLHGRALINFSPNAASQLASHCTNTP